MGLSQPASRFLTAPSTLDLLNEKRFSFTGADPRVAHPPPAAAASPRLTLATARRTLPSAVRRSVQRVRGRGGAIDADASPCARLRLSAGIGTLPWQSPCAAWCSKKWLMCIARLERNTLTHALTQYLQIYKFISTVLSMQYCE